ncbi:MAG: heavy metal transporter [Frankiales bacterium]|jgi:ATP-dependent RNA helicase DeaD|nr:heavy metal transporter [Frankiales bacterium]
MQPDGDRFSDLGLRPELLDALTALGYEEPTPIQSEAIPALLTGQDLVGQAATGTGKTAAFALPVLHRLPDGDRGKKPRALILAPTRELAMQVANAISSYGQKVGARVLAVYGGQPITPQLRALSKGVDVVVGTPGRVVDHLERGSLKLDALETVVLDEADEMLDMGFADELDAILSQVPAQRQTVLFSATLPPKIARMAKKHLNDPVRVQIEREAVPAGEAPKVTQTAHLVHRENKAVALSRLLAVHQPTAAIVFCRTRAEVDSLTEALKSRGVRAEALHGGMTQAERDRVMNRLRGGTADLLVATDVAARGLDVDVLTHVVNYNVPSAPETYVHRIGRVGRAGREGVALTLVEPRERRMVEAIEHLTGTKIPYAPVPTVADLRASRMSATKDALLAALGSDLEDARKVVKQLAKEHDPLDLAAAALSLVHASTEEEEIPVVPPRQPRPERDDARPTRGARPDRKGPAAGMAKVYVGAGRAANVAPKDLVGAIAGETHLSGKQIGSIEITERFSLVEVPAHELDTVVKALRASVIKGRKVSVRPDRNA